MKFLTLSLLATLLFSAAQAILPSPDVSAKVFASYPSCDQAVYGNTEYFAASTNDGGLGRSVRVTSLHQPDQVQVFSAPERVADVKIDKDVLYVLTSKTFEAWDLRTGERVFIYLTRPDLTRQLSWREAASGFILDQDRAIISHSVQGFTVLNLKTGKFEKLLGMPTKSSAQDIARLNETQALVAVDNDDEATFRGIYLFDLKTLEVTKQIKVDNAFSSSIRVLSGQRLMLGFFNAIWKFDLRQVLNSSEPLPLRRAWKFPGLYVVDIVGKVHFDDKNIYACFKVLDPKSGEKTLQALSFDLATLKLN